MTLQEYLNDKYNLSKREVEVARLVATGLYNKQVGELLFICEKTVKFHLTSVYRKMMTGEYNKTNGPFVKKRVQLILAIAEIRKKLDDE